MARRLQEIGVPILAEIQAPATVEGGDLLWLDSPGIAASRPTPHRFRKGQPVELAFDLFPTSNLFEAGHRIRVTVTGAERILEQVDARRIARVYPPG